MLDYPPELIAKARKVLETWQAKLLDLSRANRLLRFRETKLSTIPIEAPELATLFDWLVLRPRAVPIASAYPDEGTQEAHVNLELPTLDPLPTDELRKNTIISSYGPDQLSSALYNLRQKARSSIEERGVNVLHIALGFLVWNDPIERNERWRAPLILAPIAIDRPKPDKYTLSSLEEDVVLNPTLAYKLDHDFKVRLPELPEELETLDINSYFAEIQDAVAGIPQAVVERNAFVGLFSFLKITMYLDLARNVELLLAHPIVGRLAGLPAPVAEPLVVPMVPNELDSVIDPLSTFQVLDADSSQQEALLAARSGANLVIQGPPGTGKSQTIANLIAESLAAGRQILFVSEKAAALEVVKRRLDRCGLGEACLELHSHRADKKKILSELERTMNAPRPNAPPEATSKLEALLRARDALNAYVRALHTPRSAAQKTAYQVHGLLASVRNAPALNFALQQVTELTEGDWQSRRARMEALASHASVINSLSTHPWRGLKARTPSFAYLNEWRQHLQMLRIATEELEGHLATIRAVSGLSWPEDLHQLEGLAQFFAKYRAEILALPVIEFRQRFERHYGTWTRMLNRQYWGDLNRLRHLCRSGWTWRHSAVVVDLHRLGVVHELLTVPQNGEVNDTQMWPQVTVLGSLLNRVEQEMKFCREQFEPATFDSLGLERDLTVLMAWCREHLEQLERIDEYLAYLHERDQAVADELGEFLEAALAANLPAETWIETYFRAFYEAWLDDVVRSVPELAYFSRASHERLIEQFRALDLEQLRLARQAIAARVAQTRPQLTEAVQHAATAEIMVLAREFHKQRRIKPLRKLLLEAPTVIQDLKPCFMMSPLSVSQFLDAHRFSFDLVIFDEASQVKVEDAVGSILRGKRLVVAGDSQQLPPTRFFDVLTSDEDWDEDSEDEGDVFESILDALSAIPGSVLSKMLLWHYRSQHEALIAFSNKHFYANRLHTFPHPGEAGEQRGIEFIYVPDGLYDRGGTRKNMVEARRVVECVFQHVEQYPEWSLAVVTFSDAQRDAIQRELDRQLEQRPQLQWFFDEKKDERFDIKNLELIQGDERDAMIFSIGYGRDDPAKPPALNFGPLNTAGGRRRLNVAVTRARKHITVISSMQPEELARSENEGVRLLREYMILARDGIATLLGRKGGGSTGEVESPFEASVLDRLTAAGLEVHPQVGSSGYRIDLAVVDPKIPGRYCLGIECDGASYHSARTARDRDRLRQQVLQERGWKIHRIWSRDWNADPDREVKLVLDLVDRYAGRGSTEVLTKPEVLENRTKPNSTTQDPDRSAWNGTTPANATQTLPDGVAYYQPYPGAVRSRGIRSSPSIIADDIARIVEFQGPTHVEAIIHTLSKAWGARRAGKQLRKAIRKGVEAAQWQHLVRLSPDRRFIWPKNQQTTTVRAPRAGDEPRGMDKIPPEEIRAAVYVSLRQAGGGASEADLAGLVVRLFGYQRATQKLAEPVYSVLREMLQANELVVIDGIARTPGPLESLG